MPRVSPFVELAVGAARGPVQVRAPASPVITLVGLFGILLGSERLTLQSAISCSRSAT
jgi:XapX domain-containing protein